MNSPQLIDFQHDELKLMLTLVIKEQREVSEHLEFIEKQGCVSLLSASVKDCESRQEILELWATQLAQAIVTKEKETLVNLN